MGQPYFSRQHTALWANLIGLLAQKIFFDLTGVETFANLVHNLGALTSPVGEVVARGEDSWP